MPKKITSKQFFLNEKLVNFVFSSMEGPDQTTTKKEKQIRQTNNVEKCC